MPNSVLYAASCGIAGPAGPSYHKVCQGSTRGHASLKLGRPGCGTGSARPAFADSCASTWYPADTKEGRSSPPLRMAQLARPADTILVSEARTIWPDTHPYQLWGQCYAIFAHPTGKVGVFIFHDGHARAKKWLSTLYPLTENNWELQPNPDPKNRNIKAPPGCQEVPPPSLASKEFQTKECLEYP
jgi:hypothetical protein